MMRPIAIGEWIDHRGDRTVTVHASLFGNNVKLYECEETPRGIGRDCVEMPAYVLREFATKTDGIVSDPRQMELLG